MLNNKGQLITLEAILTLTLVIAIIATTTIQTPKHYEEIIIQDKAYSLLQAHIETGEDLITKCQIFTSCNTGNKVFTLYDISYGGKLKEITIHVQP